VKRFAEVQDRDDEPDQNACHEGIDKDIHFAGILKKTNMSSEKEHLNKPGQVNEKGNGEEPEPGRTLTDRSIGSGKVLFFVVMTIHIVTGYHTIDV
jgi:hypothetical protein